MSIPEIIAKFTRGLGLQVQQHPWTSGSAPEPGGYNPNDAELSAVLELQTPQSPQEPTPPAAPKNETQPSVAAAQTPPSVVQSPADPKQPET